jgi:hypothetical protein
MQPIKLTVNGSKEKQYMPNIQNVPEISKGN